MSNLGEIIAGGGDCGRVGQEDIKIVSNKNLNDEILGADALVQQGGSSPVSGDDRAARAYAQWRRERPDLDPLAMALFGRLNEASERVRKERMRPLFAEHGLQGGEFDVLATLRRSGAPYALNPTALYEATMVTSGAMTARIDGLEKAGLVIRGRDPEDRRGTIVSLTEAGLALIDRIISLHVENQERVLSALSGDERRELARLLGKVLAGLDEREIS